MVVLSRGFLWKPHAFIFKRSVGLSYNRASRTSNHPGCGPILRCPPAAKKESSEVLAPRATGVSGLEPDALQRWQLLFALSFHRRVSKV